MLIVLLMSPIRTINAQGLSDTTSLKTKQLEINTSIIGLGLSYEKLIAKNLTINYEIGLSYSFYVGGGSLYGNRFGYELSPIVSIENRWYYNLATRCRRHKKMNNNAGNFFCVKTGYRSTPITSRNLYDNPVIVIIPAWGLQRSIGKKLSFEFTPGYAIIFDTHQKEWSQNINLSVKLGYILY